MAAGLTVSRCFVIERELSTRQHVVLVGPSRLRQWSGNEVVGAEAVGLAVELILREIAARSYAMDRARDQMIAVSMNGSPRSMRS